MTDDGDRHVFFPPGKFEKPDETDHKHGAFWLEKEDQNKIDQLFFLKKDKLVQYVELMLKRWGLHKYLGESERFEVTRSMVVAGLQYDKLHDLQGDDYTKRLNRDIETYDKAAVELAEWLEKYMKMRQIAGIS